MKPHDIGAMEATALTQDALEQCLDDLCTLHSMLRSLPGNLELADERDRAVRSLISAQSQFDAAWALDPRKALHDCNVRRTQRQLGALAFLASPALYEQRLEAARFDAPSIVPALPELETA
jgi:hypothetical protein